MKIVSPAFRDNEQIPTRYTCDGNDVNPPLDILDIPQDARSLVLLFDDLDAHDREELCNWVHWMLLDLSPETSRIEEGRAPEGGMQGRTSFGSHRYGGPCPPHGVHRYRFRVFALSKHLNADRNTPMNEVEAAMKGSIVAQAELVCTYHRR